MPARRAAAIICAVACVALLRAEQGIAETAMPRATFVTLGTGGGPLTRVKRSEPANAVVVGDAIYLFDVGDGVQRQLVAAGLRLRDVRAIFVSHHHVDHNGDLAPVLVTRWLLNSHDPVPVIGPPGTKAMVEQVAAAFRPTELAPITIGGPKKPAIVSSTDASDLARTMDEPTLIYEDDVLRVLAITNAHYHFPPDSEESRFARSYSFRIETPGRTFVYTGDTGPSDHVVALARNADVLVSEVIDLAAMERVLQQAADIPPAALGPMIAHMEQNHLTPAEVGHLAARAQVKQVVLTHLSPGMDAESDTDGYVAGIDEHYQGPVSVARDLDRF
jgi:ribonuclease BN (tRNA processing enzyme)